MRRLASERTDEDVSVYGSVCGPGGPPRVNQSQKRTTNITIGQAAALCGISIPDAAAKLGIPRATGRRGYGADGEKLVVTKEMLADLMRRARR